MDDRDAMRQCIGLLTSLHTSDVEGAYDFMESLDLDYDDAMDMAIVLAQMFLTAIEETGDTPGFLQRVSILWEGQL